MIKDVDVENWNRRNTFEFFKNYKDPFFNIAANLDVTELHSFCKEKNLSFSLTYLFYSLKTANEIREFRIRLKDDKLFEFETIHATQTILQANGTFSFCYFEMKPDVFEFNQAGRIAVEKYKALNSFDVESERVDLIYYSVIPWISFTSFKHASRCDNKQTVPRIVFGKIFDDAQTKKMPMSVEAHHAIMDGLHVGTFFNLLQEKFNDPF
jgi:chloramphenicol O-acetyltransferase type A